MKRIGILRGGVSPEYNISLKTGGAVQQALLDGGFEAIDMLLDKEGVLHIKGIPADLEKAGVSVDYIWNALHGEFGEDGKIQRLLDQYGIPYSGSGVAASAQAFNKQTTKEYAKSLGIKTPVSLLVIPDGSESISEITARIYKTIAPPWVVLFVAMCFFVSISRIAAAVRGEDAPPKARTISLRATVMRSPEAFSWSMMTSEDDMRG
jgi:D-alanine--D-alanine ligase